MCVRTKALLLHDLSVDGIEILPGSIPPSMRMSVGVKKVAEALCSKQLVNEFSTKSAKIEVIARASKEGRMTALLAF